MEDTRKKQKSRCHFLIMSCNEESNSSLSSSSSSTSSSSSFKESPESQDVSIKIDIDQNAQEEESYLEDQSIFDINAYITKALLKEDISDLDSYQLDVLRDALMNERNRVIQEDPEARPEVYEQAIQYVIDQQKFLIKDSSVKQKREDLRQRLRQARQDHKNFVESTKSQASTMKSLFRKRIEELEEKQADELDQFENEWRSEKTLRKYNKTSSQLKQLKLQEVKLMNAHRYDEMHLVKKQANILEQKETQSMRAAMQYDYQNAKTILLEKQKTEMNILVKACRDRLIEYKSACDQEEIVINKRIEKLKRELNETSNVEKAWNRMAHTQQMARPSTARSSFSVSGRKTIKPSSFNTLNIGPLPPPQTPRRSPLPKL